MAHHVPLVRDVAKGEIVTYADVELGTDFEQVLELRRETEAMLEA